MLEEKELRKRVQSKNPSLDVLKEFIKDKEYVSASMIQRELSIGYISSQKTIQYLIDLCLLDENETGHLGHKVLRDKELLVRVIKGDWQSQKVLYMSNPMTIMNAMAKIKELVPTLPARGEGTLLVKFVEDQGLDFDYMSLGGWLIFTHRQEVPW